LKAENKAGTGERMDRICPYETSLLSKVMPFNTPNIQLQCKQIRSHTTIIG